MQLSFRKLRELHGVTDESDDAQAQDFVESRLTDQVLRPFIAVGPLQAYLGHSPAPHLSSFTKNDDMQLKAHMCGFLHLVLSHSISCTLTVTYETASSLARPATKCICAPLESLKTNSSYLHGVGV